MTCSSDIMTTDLCTCQIDSKEWKMDPVIFLCHIAMGLSTLPVGLVVTDAICTTERESAAKEILEGGRGEEGNPKWGEAWYLNRGEGEGKKLRGFEKDRKRASTRRGTRKMDRLLPPG